MYRKIILVAALSAIFCFDSLAQEFSSPKPPATFAFRGGSIVRCKSFAILEAGVLNRTAQSTSYQSLNRALFVSDIGYMRNINTHWAIGGSGHMTLGEEGTKLGMRARARYWFTPRIGLDIIPGVIVHSFFDIERMTGPGLNLGVSLTLGDFMSLDAYVESLPIRGYTYYWNGSQEIAEEFRARRTGLYIGTTGRSYLAPVVAGGVAMIAAIAVSMMHWN